MRKNEKKNIQKKTLEKLKKEEKMKNTKKTKMRKFWKKKWKRKKNIPKTSKIFKNLRRFTCLVRVFSCGDAWCFKQCFGVESTRVLFLVSTVWTVQVCLTQRGAFLSLLLRQFILCTRLCVPDLRHCMHHDSRKPHVSISSRKKKLKKKQKIKERKKKASKGCSETARKIVFFKEKLQEIVQQLRSKKN